MRFLPLQRHVLAFMAFLGVANVYLARITLSIAIVAMENRKTTRALSKSLLINFFFEKRDLWKDYPYERGPYPEFPM